MSYDRDLRQAVLSLKPPVSVVIPFGEGIELLRAQILALFAQDYSGQIDIVVACNRESFDVDALRLPSTPERTALRAVDATSTLGPSHARNVGWALATADIVLFCDADDLVHRGWISAMVSALEQAPVVGGRLSYVALNDAAQASWNFQTTTRLSRKFRHLEFAPSSNLGVRRFVLETLNGFDEALTCGEDIDFCWRAQYADFRLVFAAEAVVEYRLRADFKGLWKQSLNYGTSDAALLSRHAKFGARRPLIDSASEAAAILLALVSSLAEPSLLKKAVVRLGMFAGRVVGSVKYGKWAV